MLTTVSRITNNPMIIAAIPACDSWEGDGGGGCDGGGGDCDGGDCDGGGDCDCDGVDDDIHLFF